MFSTTVNFISHLQGTAVRIDERTELTNEQPLQRSALNVCIGNLFLQVVHGKCNKIKNGDFLCFTLLLF